LAYLGLYGFAAERAAKRVDQVKGLYANATDGLFEDLVARGEKVEELALDTAKTAQKRAVETFETTTGKVKSVVPFGANDRVEELEAEIKSLTKKMSALAKKASARKDAAKKDTAMALSLGSLNLVDFDGVCKSCRRRFNFITTRHNGFAFLILRHVKIILRDTYAR